MSCFQTQIMSIRPKKSSLDLMESTLWADKVYFKRSYPEGQLDISYSWDQMQALKLGRNFI